MAFTVQPTTTINLDDATFEVAKMSEQVQQLVRYFDDWRERELAVASELTMIRSAQRDLQSVLTQTIQRERDEAAQRAAELGLMPAPAAEVATPVPAKKATKNTAKRVRTEGDA